MFDQLTESNNSQNEPKNRRSYFVVTGLLVGALFLSGVVWSLYGKDLVLGSGDMELSSMVAPVTPPENAPRPPEPKRQRQQVADPDTKVTTRQTNTLRMEEHTDPPTGISVTPNTNKARTDNSIVDRFAIEKDGGTAGLAVGSGRSIGPGGPEGGSNERGEPIAENKIPEPPPVIKPPVIPKKDIIVSKGVINGKATSLPKPVYSAAAIAMKIAGMVNVQVTIDENGRVISARAVDGPVLLRQSAERAARDARFSPTFLSNQPVKVTGLIAYNFTRN